MREEEIKKRIEESAADLVVPESLKPEAMMETLQNLAPHTKRKFPWYYGTAAAAAIVLLGVFAVKSKIPIPGGDGSVISVETEMLAEVVPELQEGLAVLLEDSDDAVNYKAKDYDEVYDRFQLLLMEQEKENRIMKEDLEGFPGSGSALSGMVEEKMQTDVQASTDTTLAGASYSDTNTQVAGIDEGDMVKTDGSYIYAASANHGTIRIIQPKGKEMKMTGEIPDTSTVESTRTIEEFYINKDKMTVIRNGYEVIDQGEGDRQIGRAHV